EDVQIDGRRDVHDLRIAVSCEKVIRSTHVVGELVDFSKPPIDDGAAILGPAQVSDNKIVSIRLGEFRKLHVHTANPEAFLLKSFDEMAADKPPCAANQCRLLDHESLLIPAGNGKRVAAFASTLVNLPVHPTLQTFS